MLAARSRQRSPRKSRGGTGVGAGDRVDAACAGIAVARIPRPGNPCCTSVPRCTGTFLKDIPRKMFKKGVVHPGTRPMGPVA
jgi:hypothetical protein